VSDVPEIDVELAALFADVEAAPTMATLDVEAQDTLSSVEVLVGVAGPPGPPGPPGPSSGGFVFVQSTPSVTWVIDYDPALVLNVTVEDTAGTQVEGDVNASTPGQFVITFSSAFAGRARCS
jgi:hypothetical protein